MIEPEYGDVIGVYHGLYSHFGIFVDKTHIIHYSGKNDDFLLRNMEIKETDIDDFLGDSDKYFVYRFNEDKRRVKRVVSSGLDRDLSNSLYALYVVYKIRNKINFKIYSPEETVSRAKSKIGQRSFCLVSNNCEHFALWCKTGVYQSYQLDFLLDVAFVKYLINP